MAEKKKIKKKFSEKLKHKYRLVIRDDSTFEEKASLRLSRMNLYIVSSTILVILVLIVTSIITLTPLREYIPGYADIGLRRDLTFITIKTDSLEKVIERRNLYIQNIQNVVQGNIDTLPEKSEVVNELKYDTFRMAKISKADSALRADLEGTERYMLMNETDAFKAKLKNVHFFAPTTGFITSGFDMRNDHFGIDIVSPENESVKAVYNGYVVMSAWNIETGYVVAIQHNHNLLSIYKHNSKVFKNIGDYVQAGDVIAIVGNTGELTTGPHLHFELWKDGLALNPEDFIVF